MKSREILSVFILALGITGAMLPGRKNDAIALNEHELLQEMLMESNYITADELAHLLISGDPSIRLIDVRSASKFKNPLPRATNIPLDSIFEDNFLYLFDQSIYKNVIYGLEDQQATQVWVITKQRGYGNNYLLKGGLNAWRATFLYPEYPAQTASKEEFDLYEQRNAAREFFTGAKAIPKVDFRPIAPIQGRKKKKVQGGCS